MEYGVSARDACKCNVMVKLGMSHVELLDKIKELIEPTIVAAGYELWGCVLQHANKHSLLRIYIDVPAFAAQTSAYAKEVKNSVSLDDCGSISLAISAILDVEDVIRGTYNLEVSSPGLDRILFTEEQYQRFIGSNIDVRLAISEGGRKHYKGKLIAVEGKTNATIKLAMGNDETIAIPLASIARTNVIF